MFGRLSLSLFAAIGIALVSSRALAAVAVPPPMNDTTPPTLVSLIFSPASVDVTSADATVQLTVHVTDDLSGIDFNYGDKYP